MDTRRIVIYVIVFIGIIIALRYFRTQTPPLISEGDSPPAIQPPAQEMPSGFIVWVCIEEGYANRYQEKNPCNEECESDCVAKFQHPEGHTMTIQVEWICTGGERKDSIYGAREWCEEQCGDYECLDQLPPEPLEARTDWWCVADKTNYARVYREKSICTEQCAEDCQEVTHDPDNVPAPGPPPE